MSTDFMRFFKKISKKFFYRRISRFPVPRSARTPPRRFPFIALPPRTLKQNATKTFPHSPAPPFYPLLPLRCP